MSEEEVYVTNDIEITLVTIADEINREHEAARTAAVTAVEHARRAGERLLEAKSQLGHGKWLPWIREHLSFSDRTAQGYMRIARRLPELNTGEAQRVADLPLREAMAELATPSTASLDWVGATEWKDVCELQHYCERLIDARNAIDKEMDELEARHQACTDISELIRIYKANPEMLELATKAARVDKAWLQLKPVFDCLPFLIRKCEVKILELIAQKLFEHPPADWGGEPPRSRRECLRRVRDLPDSILNQDGEIDWMPLDLARREIGGIVWSHMQGAPL